MGSFKLSAILGDEGHIYIMWWCCLVISSHTDPAPRPPLCCRTLTYGIFMKYEKNSEATMQRKCRPKIIPDLHTHTMLKPYTGQ